MDRFATFALLVLAAALLVQLVVNGRDGVRDWLRAKFLGRVA